MSILIKGIDMPKERLMITIFPDGTWCGLDNVFHAGDIVEIPKHGRLIDADAFFEDICNDINAMTKIGIAVDGDWLWEKLNDALGHAPTVIEGDAG